MDTLVVDTLATHHGLEERLARARVARSSNDPDHPRDAYPPIDTFLATASRHNAALLSVLVPAAKSHLPDGSQRAKEFVVQSKLFEAALNSVKAKLYGSAYTVQRTWPSLWEDVDREFDALWRLEQAIVDDLAATRSEGDPDWGEKLHRAELKSPTRPHPNIWHQGFRGRVARAVARRVDAFWDATEGRMVPEPFRHHDREKDGPFTQYLLGDPHLQARRVTESLENLDGTSSSIDPPATPPATPPSTSQNSGPPGVTRGE